MKTKIAFLLFMALLSCNSPETKKPIVIRVDRKEFINKLNFINRATYWVNRYNKSDSEYRVCDAWFKAHPINKMNTPGEVDMGMSVNRRQFQLLLRQLVEFDSIWKLNSKYPQYTHEMPELIKKMK